MFSPRETILERNAFDVWLSRTSWALPVLVCCGLFWKEYFESSPEEIRIWKAGIPVAHLD